MAGPTLAFEVLVANLPIQNDAKNCKMIETLACEYSHESTQRELSNYYQGERVYMVLKNLWGLVIWTKVASALEGLKTGH